MAKIKTQDLIGPALDWAVAKCEGAKVCLLRSSHDDLFHPFNVGGLGGHGVTHMLCYSTNPAQGQPILERERISVEWTDLWDEEEPGAAWVGKWPNYVTHNNGDRNRLPHYGPTMLVAGLRCFVASNLGDEVEVPEELLQ